jgi:hypothetical protein
VATASIKQMDRASVSSYVRSAAKECVEIFADCRRGGSTRKHRMLMDYSRMTQKWGMLAIFNPYPRPEVHIACMLVDQAVGDGRLLRSEMICALNLIRERLRLKLYLGYHIIPVCFLALRVVISANSQAQRSFFTLSPAGKYGLFRCILTASILSSA